MRAHGLVKIVDDSVVIVMEFDSGEHAEDALIALGSDWSIGTIHNRWLAWVGTFEEFQDTCMEVLMDFGASRKSMNSLSKSGSKLSIDIPSFPKRISLLL